MPVTVRAEKMAAGGDAIARLPDGKVLFVAGALPGERVAVEVTRERKDFANGVVCDVLDAAPARLVPPCPALARGCGGCTWQHIEPGAQLDLKVEIARDALVRIGRLPRPVVRGGGSVQPWGYRTTMRLAVAADGRCGLRAARSHDVVALDACPIAHPRLSELLGGLRASGSEVVLRVADATGERAAMSDGELHGLPADVSVGGEAVVHEEVAGARLRVSVGSFFQSGRAAAEMLVQAVAGAVGDDGGAMSQAIDMYGGIGLFSAALALDRPVLVESSATACADATVNLPPDATVECTTVERWSPRSAPLVIADPARAGLGTAGVAAVVATGAERVVLVSCVAAALGRDSTLLAAAGYAHGGTTVLDLFPHTAHLEAVTTFTRG